MTSTFFGLETAKRALSAQQTALQTVGHNVANANTPGYTRQRVNLTQTNPYPAPAINRPHIPGQLGTGVKAGEIQRIRDSFTDMQYRTENSKLGYWQAKAEMLSQMEGIMNEPSDVGLANMMDQFWNALQDLAVQPQNDGARRVVRERGISLATTFNYIASSLKAIQIDYRKEIDTTQDQVNSLLRQINAINKQIGSIEPHGYLPNDLYDERDRLIDDLSKIINIRIEPRPSGGNASALAEGIYDIYLATPEGEILKDDSGRGIKLVDAKMGTAIGMHIQYINRSDQDSPVHEIKFFELDDLKPQFKDIPNNMAADNSKNAIYTISNFEDFHTNGALKGYIEGYGYALNYDELNNTYDLKGLYNDMLNDLDIMAYTFATHFNLVHEAGWSLNEIANGGQDSKQGSFFDFSGELEDTYKGAAAKLKVADHIISDVQNIAASAAANIIANVMKRADVKSTTIGNPAITGIINIGEIEPTDEDGTPLAGNWPNTSTVDIELSLKNETDENGNEKNVWKIKVIAKDEENNEYISIQKVELDSSAIELYGLKFDFSNISSPSEGDKWTITLNTGGEKLPDDAFAGDGSNALALANVKDAILNYGGTLTSVHSFYQGMIGKLGDNASEANRMEMTATVLKNSVEERRLSESSVSLDEEMINMIKFQHAYNAAARNITMIDEMLDKIINGMGIVGR